MKTHLATRGKATVVEVRLPTVGRLCVHSQPPVRAGSLWC
jgi:hypothetical protein